MSVSQLFTLSLLFAVVFSQTTQPTTSVPRTWVTPTCTSKTDCYYSVTVETASHYSYAILFQPSRPSLASFSISSTCGATLWVNSTNNGKPSISMTVQNSTTFYVDIYLAYCHNGIINFTLSSSTTPGVATARPIPSTVKSISMSFILLFVIGGVVLICGTIIIALIVVACVRRQQRLKALHAGHELSDVKYQHIPTLQHAPQPQPPMMPPVHHLSPHAPMMYPPPQGFPPQMGVYPPFQPAHPQPPHHPTQIPQPFYPPVFPPYPPPQAPHQQQNQQY